MYQSSIGRFLTVFVVTVSITHCSKDAVMMAILTFSSSSSRQSLHRKEADHATRQLLLNPNLKKSA